MAALLTPETFEFFALYLLAGYVTIMVRSRFVVTRRPSTTDSIVEAVIFSLVNQFLFAMITWPIAPEYMAFLGTRGNLLLQILVLPAVLGIVLGLNLARGWNNAILRRFSMPISQPVQRAHDYAFSTREPGFVIVSYEDGSAIQGFFGEASLASSDPNYNDLFLEQVYDVDSQGQWTNMYPERSMLLSLKGVRSIEFLKDVGDTNGQS